MLFDVRKNYVAEGVPGTRPSGDHGISFSMPYLKTGSVALWKHATRPRGPVAILLQTLAAFTCYLDEDVTLISPYAPPVNPIRSPIHTIQRTLYIICESSVFDVLGLSRKKFIGQRTIDREVTLQLINHPTPTPMLHAEVLEQYGSTTQKAKRLIVFHNEARADRDAAMLPLDYVCPEGKIHQHPRQPWLCAAMVDGHFNNYKAFKAKYIESSACPLCGAPKADQEHITTFCSKLNDVRYLDERIACLAPDLTHIPTCLRVHGIAPALSADIRGPYWDGAICKSPANENTSYGRWTEKMLRVTRRKALANAFQTKGFLDEIISQRPAPFANRDIIAKTFVLSQRDPGVINELTPMETVEGMPPDSPETFADGSVLYNPPVHVSLGSYGVYHPRRPLDMPTITQTEGECQQKVTVMAPGVTKHMGSLDGPFPSSTRTEAAGFLLMARAPYALHGALDNSVVVKTVNEFLSNLHMPFAKPWELRSNGDLFKQIEETLKQRGFESIRLTWIKGHAVEEDVLKGKITRWQADQHKINEEANKFAQKLHPHTLHEYIQVQKERTKGYKQLTKVMQLMIYRTNQAYYSKLKEMNLVPSVFAPGTIPKQIRDAARLFRATPLLFANTTNNILSLQIDTERSYVVARNWPLHAQFITSVSNVVKTFQYTEAQPNNHGITWLELAILYEYRGYHHILAMAFCEDDTSLAAIGTTIKQALHIFSSATRKAVHLLSPNSAVPGSELGEITRSTQNALFKTQDIPLHRLYYLGIMNPLQSTRSLPLISEDEEEHITKTTLGLIGPINCSTMDTLKHGNLKVCAQTINLNQQIPWERPTGALNVQDLLSGEALFVPTKKKVAKPLKPWTPAITNTAHLQRYFMPTKDEGREEALKEKKSRPYTQTLQQHSRSCGRNRRHS